MKSKSLIRSVASFTLILTLITKSLSAQPATAAAPTAPQEHVATVMKAYDVRDLLLIVKDYPLGDGLVPATRIGQMAKDLAAAQAENTTLKSQLFAAGGAGGGGGGGGGGGQAAPNTPPVPRTPIGQIERVIMDQVDPLTWKDNGGDIGSIAALNGRLFITQTAANHAAVETILAELRKGQSVTISIRADWVLLSPGQLDQLLKNGRNDKSSLPEINRDALDKLPDIIHHTGQIACFNGQTVHITSGLAKTTVTASTPVVAQDAVAYQPTAELIQYGLSLQVMPTWSADSADLDLLSIVSEPTNAPAATTEPVGPTMDHINAIVQQFHTMIHAPLNKPVLVGGMTLEPNSNTTNNPQLYLIIEANAQI